MRRLLFSIVLLTALAACGGEGDKDTEAGKRACGAMPAAIQASGLPTGFPSPTGVVYTAVSTNGPATVVSGLVTDSLDDVYNAYRQALGKDPFHVTKSEKD